jgi:hypothetical protein
MNEESCLSENWRNGVTTTLPNYDNNLALAALVPGQAAITPMCFDIGGFEWLPK